MTPTFIPLLDFAEDPGDHIRRAQATVPVFFAMTVEEHDLATFQRTEGHFVPRMVDDHGRPRDWQGSKVYAGNLYLEIQDVYGRTVRHQALRVMADSVAALYKTAAENIHGTFFANVRAQMAQGATAQDIQRLNEENAQLREELKQYRPL
jgi:hypothetical protein